MTRARWAALALAVLAAGVYANATANGFALDDEYVIVNNPRVHGTDHLPEILTEPYWPNTPERLGLYRPLTGITYAVEWEIWGDDPLPFHVTNVLLHALVTVLVFALLLGLTGLPAAVAGAAVFAVHPVHVEAVANVVGRAELLAAGLVLAAALVYLRGGLTRSRARLWGGALLIAGLYVLGLLAKEIAVTLPGLLLVLEAGRAWRAGGEWRARKEEGAGVAAAGDEGRRHQGGATGGIHATGGIQRYTKRVLARWPVYAALVATFGSYLAVRTAVLGTTVGNDAAGYLQALGPGQRVMTAVAVWPEYLRLMLFPAELVADYSPGVIMPVQGFGMRVLLGLLVAGLVALVAIRARRKAPAVGLGALVFAVAVLPVSNLLVPVGILLAERTLYLPSVGLALAVAGVWRWLESRPRWRPAAVAGLTLVLALAAARTWTRTPTWKSTDTVLATLARDHPESFRVQWLMADQLYVNDRVGQALEHYERAVALEPFHYTLRVQYGLALMKAGRHHDAVDAFQVARRTVPELPEAHIFLTVALLETGRPEEAAAAGREGLRWRPDHRGIHHQLAIALTRTGDFQAALDARRQSIRLGGESAAWTQFLHEAELLLRLGREEEAREALERARDRAGTQTAVPDLTALRAAVDTADVAVLPYR